MLERKATMILPHHPDLAAGTRGMWAIGFWKPTETEIRSLGKHNKFMELLGIFVAPPLENLPSPQDFVDPNWDPGERDLVIDYLQSGRELTSYKGYSYCRFECGINCADMGDADLTDGTFVWPSGFSHYLQAHSVRPDETFVRHVLTKAAAGQFVRTEQRRKEQLEKIARTVQSSGFKPWWMKEGK